MILTFKSKIIVQVFFFLRLLPFYLLLYVLRDYSWANYYVLIFMIIAHILIYLFAIPVKFTFTSNEFIVYFIAREKIYLNKDIVNYEKGRGNTKVYYDEDSITLYFINRWPLTISFYSNNSDYDLLLSHLEIIKKIKK